MVFAASADDRGSAMCDEHVDGFVGHWPWIVLDLLESENPPQFYRLGDWFQLFTRGDSCGLSHEAAYEPITAEEAREWAMRQING